MFSLKKRSSKKNPKIRVIVRKRPINRSELSRNELDIVEIRGKDQVVIKELK